MNKKKVLVTILSIILLFLASIFAVYVYLDYEIKKSFENYYYSEMSDSEWRNMDWYSGNKGEYLGREPGKLVLGPSKIYALEGLPTSKYLFDSNLVPHNDPDDYLIKSEDADEPILIYDVKKIVINDETEINLEGPVVEELLEVRREGIPEIGERPSRRNAKFYFDLPCDLVFECSIRKDADGIIHFVCYDMESWEFYEYDVTSILADYFR